MHTTEIETEQVYLFGIGWHKKTGGDIISFVLLNFDHFLYLRYNIFYYIEVLTTCTVMRQEQNRFIIL